MNDNLLRESFPDKKELVEALSLFIFDTPLYKSIEFDKMYREILSVYFLTTNPIRYFCPHCKDISVFSFDNNNSTIYSSKELYQNYRIQFNCASENSHKIYIFLSNILIIENKRVFFKVGQYPSIADLQFPQIQKYKSLLKRDYNEFSKAIGLNAHGVGIGSFIYLRRIIEHLLEEAHCKAQTQKDWDEDLYGKKRVLEKISSLKEYLPRILIENKESYSILSKGIHELNEDECLRYFPVLRELIELILDEKLAERERFQKEQQIKQALQEATKQIRSK